MRSFEKWLPMLPAGVCIGMLYIGLENYWPHTFDPILLGCELIAFISIICNAKVFWTHRDDLIPAAIILLSILICSGVIAVVEVIPDCIECDHVSPEELGFLSYWIH